MEDLALEVGTIIPKKKVVCLYEITLDFGLIVKDKLVMMAWFFVVHVTVVFMQVMGTHQTCFLT